MKNLVYLCLFLFLLSGCATTPRPWTPQEKTLLAWSILAVGADMITTNQALSKPGHYEINPYLTKHPSKGRVIITLSLSHLVLIGITHFYPSLRVPFLGGKAFINTAAAIHNSR